MPSHCCLPNAAFTLIPSNCFHIASTLLLSHWCLQMLSDAFSYLYLYPVGEILSENSPRASSLKDSSRRCLAVTKCSPVSTQFVGRKRYSKDPHIVDRPIYALGAGSVRWWSIQWRIQWKIQWKSSMIALARCGKSQQFTLRYHSLEQGSFRTPAVHLMDLLVFGWSTRSTLFARKRILM